MRGEAQDLQEAIARAKQDWECTADSLSHVVCLVDADRRVVRVNRAIEAWQLGRVNEVVGADIHDLLHPSACGGECALAVRLRSGWLQCQNATANEFELFDSHLKRAICVTLRPIVADSDGHRPQGDSHAVMVVMDMTAMHLARVAELERANYELQNEVVRREAAEEAARLSRSELALLSQQLIQAQEKERRRIARELHDSAGQSLSAIKYSLERAAELQRQNKHADAAPLLSRTIGLVRETITEIRAIAMDLRPSLLDDLGVASALGWLCREFAETYAQFEVRTEIAAGDAEIPDRLSTTIFRCAQELLNNAAKHSRARRVSVGLLRGSNSVTLSVSDDGIGMPQPNSSGSFGRGHGIRNLRERAQMTGGRMIIGGNSGTGTRVQVDWPLATRDMLA